MRTKLFGLAAVLVVGGTLAIISTTVGGETGSPTTRAAVGPATPPPTPPSSRVRRVAIVVYDGVEILDLAGPAEVLAVAGGFAGHDGPPALELYTVGRTVDPITAQGFVTIVPQYSIETAPPPDLVVIPGGSSRALSDDPAMMRWLTERAGAAEATLTVCTGAFPLARSGALDGLEITTWYGAVERLQALAPKAHVAHGRRFVDSGTYVTTAGVSAGIDGALHLVARLFGRRVADQTARYMEYHWTPEPYLATRYAYLDPSTDDGGRAMQRADQAVEEQRWAEAIPLYRAVIAMGRGGARAPYNLACALARSGDEDAALAAAADALAAGVSLEQALADDDLASIRDRLRTLPAR